MPEHSSLERLRGEKDKENVAPLGKKEVLAVDPSPKKVRFLAQEGNPLTQRKRRLQTLLNVNKLGAPTRASRAETRISEEEPEQPRTQEQDVNAKLASAHMDHDDHTQGSVNTYAGAMAFTTSTTPSLVNVSPNPLQALRATSRTGSMMKLLEDDEAVEKPLPLRRQIPTSPTDSVISTSTESAASRGLSGLREARNNRRALAKQAFPSPAVTVVSDSPASSVHLTSPVSSSSSSRISSNASVCSLSSGNSQGSLKSRSVSATPHSFVSTATTNTTTERNNLLFSTPSANNSVSSLKSLLSTTTISSTPLTHSKTSTSTPSTFATPVPSYLSSSVSKESRTLPLSSLSATPAASNEDIKKYLPSSSSSVIMERSGREKGSLRSRLQALSSSSTSNTNDLYTNLSASPLPDLAVVSTTTSLTNTATITATLVTTVTTANTSTATTSSTLPPLVTLSSHQTSSSSHASSHSSRHSYSHLTTTSSTTTTPATTTTAVTTTATLTPTTTTTATTTTTTTATTTTTTTTTTATSASNVTPASVPSQHSSHSSSLVPMSSQPSAGSSASIPSLASSTSSKSYRKEKDEVHYVNGKQFFVLELIGQGGSSKVYRVLSKDKKVFALKRISIGGEANHVANYQNEIALLKRMKGRPYVIQLIESQEDTANGVIYMVFELGTMDLAHFLQLNQNSKTWDNNSIRYYWKQILECTQMCHDEKIIHLDLKPPNFVLVDGCLKLIDFGIAKEVAADATSILNESNIGTLDYMSPESVVETSAGLSHGHKLGRSTDVWSLGCILYQMVYGSPPLRKLSMMQKMRALMDPKFVIPFGPCEDLALLQVMKSCLRYNPKERPTIAELLTHPYLAPKQDVIGIQHIEAILAQLGVSASAQMAKGIVAQIQAGQAVNLAMLTK